MTKSKVAKKNMSISSERLAELRRATLIVSTDASVRLEGSKVTNKKVEQILDALSKPSEQKLEYQTKQNFLCRFALNHVRFYQRS